MTALKTAPFDAAEYLDSEEAIAEYLSAALEEDDPALFLSALADAVKARGMTKMAKDAGIGRESLYKTLAPGARPRYDTVLKLARAAGAKLTVEPLHSC
ncbi:putative addiction module antidote protein [Alcaligenes sp. SORT26]|uniref:addiction module antidote protein n=1 Tax=Alcaligenes sp. SORT26 TaxID=2813780 RepID=UPI001A9CC4DE|nr:addiction module antidote protein [Alcaligenes sp. SORT26]QTC00137.1 putative addiction module antidote protein [Alcaligenes sp. SORT26]